MADGRVTVGAQRWDELLIGKQRFRVRYPA